MRKYALLASAALALLSCKKSRSGGDLMTIDGFCPGMPDCTGEGDGVFHAGAGYRPIVPALLETSWNDANANNVFEPSSEAFVDSNGNLQFDALWLAGFDNARPAIGFADELSARAIAMRWNDVTVAVVYIDTIGLFANDIEDIRFDPSVTALDLDHVVIGSSHVHEAPDTVGLWGIDPLTRGVSDTYLALVKSQTAAAIADAVADLKSAQMTVAQTLTVGTDGTTLGYVNDVRDPVIYDPTVTIAHFTSGGGTIATLVNWGSHPEYTGDENNLITADYVHTLRETIENGDATTATPGLGGTTVFVQGMVGGQIGPSGTVPVDENGVPISPKSLAKAYAAGRAVALKALEALETATPVTGEIPVSYRTAEIFAQVDNAALQLAQQFGVLVRERYLWDETQPISETNVPHIRSRVTYVQAGPLAFITAPGELHPELWIGGYDGSWSFGRPMLTETENVPDFADAPAPPYLKELMLDNPGAQYVFVAGLGEDFLGYIVPSYNYVLHPTNPYLDEAAGDHYEETYSVGPRCEEQLQHPMMKLAKARP